MPQLAVKSQEVETTVMSAMSTGRLSVILHVLNLTNFPKYN